MVEIQVPALDESFDFMLDEEASVDQIIGELDEMLSRKVKQPVSENRERFVLCWPEKMRILNRGGSLAAEQVTDGARLLLI